MATYTSGKDLAKATRARTARIKKAIAGVPLQQATSAKATARGLTRGPQRPLSAPSPVTPKLPIGRRTGKLFASWRVKRLATGDPSTRAASLSNRAPHHRYVLRPGGTRTMSDRGYWQAHRAASLPTTRTIARKALERAMKG